MRVFTVGMDMGGTFTDGYFSDGQRATVCKVPTTHFDLTRSVMSCLAQGSESFGLELEDFLASVGVLRLATTIGTNSVVEGTGDAIGVMVDTAAVSSLYGSADVSPALGTFVRPDQVVGIAASAEVEDVLKHCRHLVLSGVRQVVVSFQRERGAEEVELRKLVRDRYPAHYLRSIPLTLGSEVANVDDDELRTTTTVLNAYVSRSMAKLMYRTEGLLQQSGLTVPLLAVRSDATCSRIARTSAIGTYSSGPASGLSLVAELAARFGDPVVLGFDMGGTTLDLGLARDGQYVVDQTPEIRGVRISLPVPSIESVGLGGSSIASVEASGVVMVGPASAGAVPGPASFGRGGSEATLTDADLALGFLTADQQLTSDIALDLSAALAALGELGPDPLEAAHQVRAAAHQKAASEIAALLDAANVRARDVALYAFGGAGPLHAGAVADLAGIFRVRSFPYGGVFSARGVAGSPITQRYEASVDQSGAEAVIVHLVHRGMLDLAAEQLPGDRCEFVLELADADGTRRSCTIEGSQEPSQILAAVGGVEDVVLVSLTTTLAAPLTPAVELEPTPARAVQPVWWDRQLYETPEIDLATLAEGSPVHGPALVNVAGSAHAIPPGWSCRRDSNLDLLWERETQ